MKSLELDLEECKNKLAFYYHLQNWIITIDDNLNESWLMAKDYNNTTRKDEIVNLRNYYELLSDDICTKINETAQIHSNLKKQVEKNLNLSFKL